MPTAAQTTGRVGLVLFAIAVTGTTAAAQNSDGDWLPWLGCWRAEEAPSNESLCIVPENGGVRLITVESGALRGESRIIPDRRTRAVRQEGCAGTELAHWSSDGRRVFLNSALKCEGDVSRTASGVFVITGPAEWLSVQAVTVDGRTAARTVRYRSIDPMIGVPSSITRVLGSTRALAADARRAALAPIDESDVDEAVNAIDAVAVQEWLSATDQPFQLDGGGSDGSLNTVSALDLIGGSARAVRTTREVVHVVERPVVVHHTTVHTVYRSCWDPFVSGHVSIGRGAGVHVGISNGCSRHYYGRYSPWGYDLYGWRQVHSPIVIVRGGPTIIRRPPYYRGGGTIVVRDRDRYDRDNRYDRDSRYDRDNRYDRGNRNDRHDEPRNRGGEVTRGGYTSGPARERATTQRAGSGSRAPSAPSAPILRTSEGTRTAAPSRARSSEPTRTRSEPERARSSSARESSGSTQAPSRAQGGSGRTAKARN